MSENRRINRYLKLRAKKGRLNKKFIGGTYADNKGYEYHYKWVAQVSSFYNVIMGCFKNGFPVVVPKLWYSAWAFYPFFFIHRGLDIRNSIPTLNHERIHIRQQRDIHSSVSLPLIFLCTLSEWFGWFNTIYLLCIVPFIPTLFYGVEMLRSWWNLYEKRLSSEGTDSAITFKRVRENTCYEREAVSRSTNENYLYNRKFWAVLAYTGFKPFQNYGIK